MTFNWYAAHACVSVGENVRITPVPKTFWVRNDLELQIGLAFRYMFAMTLPYFTTHTCASVRGDINPVVTFSPLCNKIVYRARMRHRSH